MTDSKTVVPVAKPLLVTGGKIAAIIPQDIDQAYRQATLIVKSGMAPKAFDTPEKAVVAIMHGLELGLSPMAALQSIAVVNGQPTLYGDGMMALVRASGLLEDIIETVEDDKEGPTIATCKVKRVGTSSWVIHSFTRPQAMRAGLWKKAGPWVQYPQRMMQMRARSWALRDAFPDVLRGLHSAEEMLDVTARSSATTAPPEPRRSDYVDVPDHDPETGEVLDRPWAIPDSVVGADARRKVILDMLGLARVKADVDEIHAEHQDFIDKLGRAKVEVLEAFDNRIRELPERLEVEA